MIHKLVMALIVIGSALPLFGCSSDDDDPVLTSDTIQSLQGNWERRGYGEVITVEGANVTTYDYTTATCVLADVDSVDDLDEPVFSDDNAEFTTKDAPVSFVEHYYRTDALPATCSTPIGNTPSDIYNHMWSTFDEYYAFFNERNVDWLAQLDATRDDIRADMSDDELFDVLSTMIEPIDDQHVGLRSPENSFDPAQPKGFLAELRRDFESQSEIVDLEGFIAQELALWESNIENTYLDGNYDSGGGPLDNIFTWGVMENGIGYLRIDLMILNFEQAIAFQVNQVELILDEALQDLANTQGLIIDLRMNPGGTDPVAFAIANRFTDTERLAVSKFSRSVVGQGETQSITLTPVERPNYLKPVVLMTSALTTSGAEVFTLAMRSLPQVTQLGENTNGAISDLLEKSLPNGWSFELANEVYLDADGNSFESVGIPPHVNAPVFDLELRHAGRDSAIDAALNHLGFNQ